MKEIIKIEMKEDIPVVSAKELHSVLQIRESYKKWLSNHINTYKLDEGIDYYQAFVSLEMAKDLALLEKSNIGLMVFDYITGCKKTLQKVNLQSRKFYEVANTGEQKQREFDNELLGKNTSELLCLMDSTKFEKDLDQVCLLLVTKCPQDYLHTLPNLYFTLHTLKNFFNGLQRI